MSAEKIKENTSDKEISIRYIIVAALFWIITISWIVMIFHLSNQTAVQSSNTSNMIVNVINEILGVDIEDDTVIRKVAHATEFAILTIFTYVALSSTNKISNQTSYAESPVKLMRSDNEMNIVFTLWFTILNAIFDEYHQLFVDGRDGSIKDVLIDLIGIVIVLIIIRIAFTIYLKTKGKSEIVYT
jgi:VanZ family protein